MKADVGNERSGRERIVAESTKLFATHGYAGVSTRQIASETGLSVSTVHHHAGSKRGLYLQVIENLYEKEEQLLDENLDTVDDDVIQDRGRFEKALHQLIERLLEFAHENPDRQRLYMMRWLEPADALSDREAELTLRLYKRLAAILKRGQELGRVRSDLNLGYFIRSFDWLIFSYFVSGAFSWKTLRKDPLSKDTLQEFKRFLFDYMKHMLGPGKE